MDNNINMFILASKLSRTKEDNKIIEHLFNVNLDWEFILYNLIRHRVAPLMYNTFRELNLLDKLEIDILYTYKL